MKDAENPMLRGSKMKIIFDREATGSTFNKDVLKPDPFDSPFKIFPSVKSAPPCFILFCIKRLLCWTWGTLDVDVATKLHYSNESLIPSDAVKKQGI
jgi:hypothetical protein